MLFDDAVITIFVDDVSILTTAPKKEDAKTVTQSATNTVFYWSQQWKLDLNASSNEVCHFSTCPASANGILHSQSKTNKFQSILLLIFWAKFWTGVTQRAHPEINLFYDIKLPCHLSNSTHLGAETDSL